MAKRRFNWELYLYDLKMFFRSGPAKLYLLEEAVAVIFVGLVILLVALFIAR